MTRAAQSLLRLVGYFLGVFAAAVFLTAAIWVVAWVWPLLFERTTALVAATVGEATARDLLVSIFSIVVFSMFAAAAGLTWRIAYLAPRVGGEDAAADVRHSVFEWFVVTIGVGEAIAIVLLLPGAFGVLGTIGSWLPAGDSPGVIGLAAVLTVVVGTTVYVGDFLDLAWRSRPRHDLWLRH